MQQRDRSAYNALATGLMDLAAIYDLQLRPEFIISDFEAASHSVFSQMFQARMVGCLFHYSQALYRWIIQNHLGNYYEQYESMRRFYRTMAALAFLPANVVASAVNHYMQFFRSGALDD